MMQWCFVTHVTSILTVLEHTGLIHRSRSRFQGSEGRVSGNDVGPETVIGWNSLVLHFSCVKRRWDEGIYTNYRACWKCFICFIFCIFCMIFIWCLVHWFLGGLLLVSCLLLLLVLCKAFWNIVSIVSAFWFHSCVFVIIVGCV